MADEGAPVSGSTGVRHSVELQVVDQRGAGSAVDEQSQPQVSVLVVMVHHAQDQKHDEQEHIDHRWARD